MCNDYKELLLPLSFSFLCLTEVKLDRISCIPDLINLGFRLERICNLLNEDPQKMLYLKVFRYKEVWTQHTLHGNEPGA